MLKKKLRQKILITTAVLFAFFLMYFMPNDESQKLEKKQILNYLNPVSHTEAVYLMDPYQMVARTNVSIAEEKNVEKKAMKLLQLLIRNEESSIPVPSGFQGLLPAETKIISVKYEDHVIKVNFSKELLNIDEKNEEKMVEAIVYTLTEIDGVEKVILYVEDNILTKLPKSKINLPATLDRSYGINKDYALESYKNVEKVNIYYVSKFNDQYYYVPVTKYVNDSRDKVKIIIEELASNPIHQTNLMSFLNSNTKLLSAQEEVDSLFLVFNEYIFSDMDTKNILEEVIYSISLSVRDSYNVKEVVFQWEDNEIYKSVLKTLE